MTSGNFDKDSLQVYFNRIVDLEKEKKAEVANFKEDIKALYGEARDAGFSPKILRAIVAEHLGPKKPQEDLDLEAIYRDALGLTPLEQAAADREGKARGEAVAPDVDPPFLVAALDIVEKVGQGRLTCQLPRDVDEDAGADSVIEVVKVKGKKGPIGGAFDLADSALLEGGWRSLGKARYRAPENTPPAAESAAQEDPPAPEQQPAEETEFDVARRLVLDNSAGMVDVAPTKQNGVIEITRSANARGSIGERFDDVHQALLEAGYRHVAGGRYALPGAEIPAPPENPATPDGSET